MDENQVCEKLARLINEISGLPRDKPVESLNQPSKTNEKHEPATNTSAVIEKTLSDLSVLIQYMLFDLEVTKRERNALRHALRSMKPKDKDESDDAP